MDTVIQGGLSMIILLFAGTCVSDIPTGEELFEMQQTQTRAVPDMTVRKPHLRAEGFSLCGLRCGLALPETGAPRGVNPAARMKVRAG